MKNLKYNQMQDRYKEIFYNIGGQSKGIAADLLDILERNERFSGRNVTVKLSHPENWIFYILIFMNLQILKNKYPNQKEPFFKYIRKQLSFITRIIMKREIKKIESIFNNSIKDRINPIENIIAYFYKTITGMNANPITLTGASLYLAKTSSFFSREWDKILNDK